MRVQVNGQHNRVSAWRSRVLIPTWPINVLTRKPLVVHDLFLIVIHIFVSLVKEVKRQYSRMIKKGTNYPNYKWPTITLEMCIHTMYSRSWTLNFTQNNSSCGIDSRLIFKKLWKHCACTTNSAAAWLYAPILILSLSLAWFWFHITQFGLMSFPFASHTTDQDICNPIRVSPVYITTMHIHRSRSVVRTRGRTIGNRTT